MVAAQALSTYSRLRFLVSLEHKNENANDQQREDAMQWQAGDLVFTQIGDPENAISAVTSGWKDARVNHMGVVTASENGCSVLEAYVPGVQLTKLEEIGRAHV